MRKRSMLSKTAWIIMISLSSAQFVTWTKIPKDPTFGAAGEKITLEWKYVMNLKANHSFDYFVIRRFQPSKGDYDDIVKYGRNGQEIVYERYKGRFALAENATPELLLIKAEESDERKYCCKVYSQKDNVQKCVTLKILVRPNITSISTDQTSNETDDVVLSCDATGKPFPNITWLKQGKKEWKHTGSPLLLKNISRYQDGEYRCTATNYAGNATASIRVTVNYKPLRTSLTYSAKGDVVQVKDTVIFSCSADSLPPPQLELRFKNKTLGLFQNGNFSLQHVNISDEGVYECIARNVLGTGAIARLNLKVQVSPTITFISHDTTVNETDDVTLFCNASGKPDPTVTWSFPESHPKRMAVTNETILLRRASKDVAGRYRCTSANGVGNPAVAEVQVAINYKPEIKNKFSSDVVSWINHKTVITCTAEGFPVPDITWSHNGVVQSSALKTSAQSRTRHSTLTFTPQGAKDFGVYACIARNFLGTDKKETTVGELDAPKAPEVFRIETGMNKLEIQWKKLSAIPLYPILCYLVQIRKKREWNSWVNFTQITTKDDDMIGVINNLEANMKYIVRISARNIVGYGKFTVKEVSTKQVQGKGKQPLVPRHMIKWIIVGVAGLVIVMVAIALVARKGRSRSRVIERGQLQVDGNLMVLKSYRTKVLHPASEITN
ncbi:neural cell adhesion molecule 1-like isoform X1 [Montipora capricornis]|uniref:neural cell adhesion molecule 1-like isoform X1 n=1 Tax=Montipora capricornis TaxID=246305 RepID=UPI0035F10293